MTLRRKSNWCKQNQNGEWFYIILAGGTSDSFAVVFLDR